MNETYTAHASVEIMASPTQVWEALTTPELVSQYFFGSQVESDWKVGSPLIYRGEWEGQPYEDRGEILQAEPPWLLKSTYFSPLTGQEDTPENYMIITYALAEKDGGTLLTVTQENCRSEEARAQSEGNWQLVLSNLKQLVEQ
ncbi:MAG: SRPBCC domain-containing protein [Anaerolineales bacterium]|nr:SRPBCC domain-containing protein [Anaerolineales bacterium]